MTTVYCFPGQGSDRRQFEGLALGTSFRKEVIEYGTPANRQTMASFAKDLASQIDTTQSFVLLGVSLGGMLCVELAELLSPQKTIIISSAKNRNEYPYRYKFSRTVRLYQAIPGSVLLAGAKFLQPLVEPDCNKYPDIFNSMLGCKDATYMSRTIEMIITWDRTSNTKPIWHIHGTSDRTLPIRWIRSPNFIIEKGSHMITITRAEEISKILNEILIEKGPKSLPSLV